MVVWEIGVGDVMVAALLCITAIFLFGLGAWKGWK